MKQFDHSTEMRFASFLFGGFMTAIVVNPREIKLEKQTSVHSTVRQKKANSFVCFLEES